MKHFAFAVLIVSAVSCGGDPSAPSTSSALDGTWRGTITIAGVASPTSWVFAGIPNTSGREYSVQVTSVLTAQPITANAALFQPGQFPSELHANGFWDRPQSCRSSFQSIGQVETPNTLTASFYGVDCPAQFDGTVTLTR